MRIFLFALLISSTFCFSQNKQILDFDDCKENISKKSINQFEKAISLYSKKKYSEAITILREVIENESDFASPYFVIGLIGTKTDNVNLIEKYFPKVIELCPNYSEPLLHYYLGIIDYSNEKFEKAKKNFEKFLALSQEYELHNELINSADNYLQWCEFLADASKNKVEFKPLHINDICTKDDEYNPFITLDKKKIFFTRKAEIFNDVEESFYQKPQTVIKELFCMASLQNDGSYDKGFPIGEPFNLGTLSSSVSLTADNREIYFSMCKSENEGINCDIYYSEWLGEYWSDFKSVGSNINTKGTIETEPCISHDGKTLYFSSNRLGGYGGYDIWIARKSNNGSWLKPVNAGGRINTKADEKSPFMHADGVSFFFSSNGWKGFGGFDLFYTKLDDKRMKEPINLGAPINTINDEKYINVTLDGKGYFSSNNIEGFDCWNIFCFDIDKKYRPLKTKLVKGNISNFSNDRIESSIEVIRLSDKMITNYDIDPLSGNFALALLEGEAYLLKAKKEGFAFETKYLLALDTTTNIQMQLNPLQVGEGYVIKDIHFASNSYALSPQAEKIIDAFVEYLHQYPKIRCTIEGHTDNIGSEQENHILSEQRARAVAEYIIKSRIREDRIRYEGFGAKKPISNNNNEQARAKNRRTIFRIDSM